MSDELLPPISCHTWWGVAVHEAGHAVAYIHAAQAVYGNPRGCRSVHIRPGMSPHWVDDRGRQQQGSGACQSSGIFDMGMSRYQRVPPREYWPELRLIADWEIVGCLAGPLAELTLYGSSWPRPDLEDIVEEAGGGEDLQNVDILLEDLKALGRRRPSIKRHMLRTLRLVEDNSDAIEALAERLQIQHHLEFEEVWETVAPHLMRDLKAAA